MLSPVQILCVFCMTLNIICLLFAIEANEQSLFVASVTSIVILIYSFINDEIKKQKNEEKDN